MPENDSGLNEVNEQGAGQGTGEADVSESAETAADSAGESAAPGSLGDLFRRAVVAGLGTAMVGEEVIRGALRELSPGAKEALSAAKDQADRGRSELKRLVGDEVRRWAESPALKKEISRALSSVAIEMTVRIRLNPDGSGPDITFSQPRICRDAGTKEKDAENAAEKEKAGEGKRTDEASCDAGTSR